MLEADELSSGAPRHELGPEPSRVGGLAARSSDAAGQVERLCGLSVRGLQQMYVGAGMFVQTMRGLEVNGSRVLRGEGDNLRYAAIVALGLSQLPEEAQRRVLKGNTAADLAFISADRATESPDAGAVALAIWAAAEIGEICASELIELLTLLLAPERPVETVSCAWALTAAIAADRHGDSSDLMRLATDRLLAGQSTSGLFPHLLPAEAGGWGRAHIGCFADQVYPIQALARFAIATGDQRFLKAADACADRICAVQGSAGQWWWHYDVRNGGVVEGYPVYSVHQHAMAPMALLELWEAGGSDHWAAVQRGLSWLDRHPESATPLIAERDGVIWRKIGRREPPKAVRSISAFTTGLQPGLHVPGLDLVFPPGRVDYECRPYELGWLLYTWRSAGLARRSRHPEAASNV